MIRGFEGKQGMVEERNGRKGRGEACLKRVRKMVKCSGRGKMLISILFHSYKEKQ